MLLETVPVLATIWFVLVAVLWVAFFFLEGFDFGVAMLLPVLGRTDRQKRTMINTIGPVWDGNEVWLLTAGGAMFAAFPGWYASLFSALYLPLLLVLVGLILRGVSFEYRSKNPEAKWRNMFDWFATIGSFLPTLVLGVGFANFVIGVANDNLLWNGSFFGLFGPFALLGGVMLVLLSVTHGATFLALKTRGEMHEKARVFVKRIGWFTAGAVALFVLLQNALWPSTSEFGDLAVLGWALAVITILAITASVWLTIKDRDGWAFVLGGLSFATLIAGMFVRMYGNLGFAQADGVPVGDRINIVTAASSETTLTIMTIAAAIFVPVVIAYQAWSYWVFSRRISTKNIPVDVEVAA